MFETGWSEARLAAASDRTVRAMRHALYTRANAQALGVQVDDELADLAKASLKGAAAESARQAGIRKRRQGLLSLRSVQATLRRLLFLDDKTPVPEDEE